MRASSVAHRRTVARESFKTAAECIGPIEPGMSLFAITRGQFSMIDAVLHTLDCVGPARVTLWTWTVAEYEIDSFNLMRSDGRVTAGRLIIDAGAREKNAELIRSWCASFGKDSVRYVVNHAKIATVQTATRKVLLRGSMNLNFNPRFEQLDVTEGGPDFDLVQRIEDELPVVAHKAPYNEARAASKLHNAFDPQTLDLFGGKKLKVWAK